ncbi:MAG: beta-lactamase family protein [Clostridia bacterium]|nr:beta-lactamase family protein [Clostridia bacterium]
MFRPDFKGFSEEIKRQGWNVHGAELWLDGKPAASFGDTGKTRFPVYSITKAVTFIAAGMAADDGLLTVNDPLLQHLPEKYARAMSGDQRKAYEHITLRRLMTMSVAGYPFAVSGEDWLENALSIPLSEPEKLSFNYSNVSAYLVGVAAAEATGERLDQYLNRRLFAPLGIPDPHCQFSPEGYFYGASGLELTVNELSRIGQMLSDGGIYEGKRILSEAYVKEAVSVQQMNREGGYGYFFWKYRDGFSMNGKWGQKCYVLPKQKTIVTFLSHMEEGSDPVRECMEKYLLG